MTSKATGAPVREILAVLGIRHYRRAQRRLRRAKRKGVDRAKALGRELERWLADEARS